MTVVDQERGNSRFDLSEGECSGLDGDIFARENRSRKRGVFFFTFPIGFSFNVSLAKKSDSTRARSIDYALQVKESYSKSKYRDVYFARKRNSLFVVVVFSFKIERPIVETEAGTDPPEDGVRRGPSRNQEKKNIFR